MEDAAACKAVYAGSILTLASIKPPIDIALGASRSHELRCQFGRVRIGNAPSCPQAQMRHEPDLNGRPIASQYTFSRH
jgi:hypothetical protein